MPKPLSGKEVIKLLCREFGFYFYSQKGSHVKLKKDIGSRELVTIVPLHKELASGTMKSILKLAEIEVADFWGKLQ